MNAHVPPIHFALQNGTHAVLLCDPSRLTTHGVRSTLEFRFVTCSRCVACREQDKQEFRDEVQKRMTSPGAPKQ